MLDIDIDGTRAGGDNGLALYQAYTNTGAGNLSFCFLTDVLSAGSHTFKLKARVSGGATMTLYGTNTGGAIHEPLMLQAVEQNT
jgi:hypothetical protein